MLGEGECSEGAVKRPPCTSDLALVHQKLAVVQPYPRHLVYQYATLKMGVAWGRGQLASNLVHEDECPLKCIVDLFKGWICDATTFDLLTTELEIVVPKFVTETIEEKTDIIVSCTSNTL